MIFRYCLVYGIGHVLLLHGAVDHHFGFLGARPVQLSRDSQD